MSIQITSVTTIGPGITEPMSPNKDWRFAGSYVNLEDEDKNPGIPRPKPRYKLKYKANKSDYLSKTFASYMKALEFLMASHGLYIEEY